MAKITRVPDAKFDADGNQLMKVTGSNVTLVDESVYTSVAAGTSREFDISGDFSALTVNVRTANPNVTISVGATSYTTALAAQGIYPAVEKTTKTIGVVSGNTWGVPMLNSILTRIRVTNKSNATQDVRVLIIGHKTGHKNVTAELSGSIVVLERKAGIAVTTGSSYDLNFDATIIADYKEIRASVRWDASMDNTISIANYSALDALSNTNVRTDQVQVTAVSNSLKADKFADKIKVSFKNNTASSQNIVQAVIVGVR